MSKISVILPIYNAEKYLSESITSILNQTFADFELLAIDDGSTDDSLKILKAFDDSRIIIIHNNENLGLIHTLNIGIELAKGEYIARMDADDISLPTRFEKQVKILDSNPDIGVCSTWIEFLGDKNDIIKFPTEHEEIYLRFLLSVQVGHANSMIRRNILDRLNIRYDSHFPHSEDTNLWIRMLQITKFTNIPEVLYRYRRYSEQISVVHNSTQKDSFNRSLNIHFNNICDALGVQNYDYQLYKNDICSLGDIIEFEDKIEKLLIQNKSKKIFNHALLLNVLLQLWKNKIRLSTLSTREKLNRIFSKRIHILGYNNILKKMLFFYKLN